MMVNISIMMGGKHGIVLPTSVGKVPHQIWPRFFNLQVVPAASAPGFFRLRPPGFARHRGWARGPRSLRILARRGNPKNPGFSHRDLGKMALTWGINHAKCEEIEDSTNGFTQQNWGYQPARTGFGLQLMVGGCNWGMSSKWSVTLWLPVLLTRSYDYSSSLKTHNYPPVDGLSENSVPLHPMVDDHYFY